MAQQQQTTLCPPEDKAIYASVPYWARGLFAALTEYVDAKFSAASNADDARHKELLTRLEKIMENEQQIEQEEQAELTAIGNLTTAVGKVATMLGTEATQIATLQQQVATLQQQQASGSPITQQQLEDIGTGLRARATEIQAQADALNAAVAPPSPPAGPATPGAAPAS